MSQEQKRLDFDKPCKRIFKWTGSKLHRNKQNGIRNLCFEGNKFVFRKRKVNHQRKKLRNSEKSDSQRGRSTEASISDHEISESRMKATLTENDKLMSKVNKTRLYWDSSSSFIPNVFKFLSFNLKEKDLSEYQDLSKKEVLAQNAMSKEKRELFDSIVVSRKTKNKKITSKNSNN